MGGDLKSTRPPSMMNNMAHQTIVTNRTASGGVATMSAFASANDSKTVRTVRSIKRSMNKLEAISQMNWSKKDVPPDYIAAGNLVFNKVHATNEIGRAHV